MSITVLCNAQPQIENDKLEKLLENVIQSSKPTGRNSWRVENEAYHSYQSIISLLDSNEYSEDYLNQYRKKLLSYELPKTLSTEIKFDIVESYYKHSKIAEGDSIVLSIIDDSNRIISFDYWGNGFDYRLLAISIYFFQHFNTKHSSMYLEKMESLLNSTNESGIQSLIYSLLGLYNESIGNDDIPLKYYVYSVVLLELDYPIACCWRYKLENKMFNWINQPIKTIKQEITPTTIMRETKVYRINYNMDNNVIHVIGEGGYNTLDRNTNIWNLENYFFDVEKYAPIAQIFDEEIIIRWIKKE